MEDAELFHGYRLDALHSLGTRWTNLCNGSSIGPPGGRRVYSKLNRMNCLEVLDIFRFGASGAHVPKEDYALWGLP